MHTTIDEIAPDIFRLSTYVAEVAPPAGFTFNQFLVRGERAVPVPHRDAPAVPARVRGRRPDRPARATCAGSPSRHVEADECGAMNQFLAAAPDAQVVHGELACMVSLNDLADRPPPSDGGDEVLDIGGHRLRFLPTPHVPHNWESGLWFDETTRTLLRRRPVHAGRRRAGDRRPTTSSSRRSSPRRSSTPRRSARTCPDAASGSPTSSRRRSPTMHGSSFRGDGAAQLRALASGYATFVTDAAA